jgi:hypothetical protein
MSRASRQESQKLMHLGTAAILWNALARLCDSTTLASWARLRRKEIREP